mmetsp:Transcript_18995/g.13790  ORF Transcript_18995/g.13790 Transcript_18995/m.13790 type:complete len:159 (-) Transcript_18995:760-1236(-)
MEGVFHKFDVDGSGFIDLAELHSMFKVYGINISRLQLKHIFSIVDSDGNGIITLDEFKRFAENEQANDLFKQLIRKIREEHQRRLGGLNMGFMPFNLSRMLDHVSHMTKRDQLLAKIDHDKDDVQKMEQTVKNFVKLFILDEGAKDSIVKEKTAVLVE